VQQIVLVSAAPESPGPHRSPPRLDGRSRLGEYLQSAKPRSSATRRRPRAAYASSRFGRPTTRSARFDFNGGYDDQSRRKQGLGELIEPRLRGRVSPVHRAIVGASGEKVGRTSLNSSKLTLNAHLKSQL